MTSSAVPTCRIIAGPNGAGKTTFALHYLAAISATNFVNADLIAAGLSPLAPSQHAVAASRLFLREIEEHIRAGRDFAFETTLSGLGHRRLIEQLRAQGWRVELSYLALLSVEMSERRVAERVAHGGHSIPRAVIQRRFPRSLRNLFEHYAAAVDVTRCFLNTGPVPELIFVQRDNDRIVFRPELLEQLPREASL